VGHHSEAFIGIDTAKLRNAIAVAETGRNGEVRYLGEVDAREGATRKLVAKLAAKYSKLTFCYEAGPTGYGLHRLIEGLDHTCIVAAPSEHAVGWMVGTPGLRRGQASPTMTTWVPSRWTENTRPPRSQRILSNFDRPFAPAVACVRCVAGTAARDKGAPLLPGVAFP
jgi:hypothetical protein